MGHVRSLIEEYRIVDFTKLNMGRRLVDEHEQIQLRINEQNIYSWLSEKIRIFYEIYGKCLSLRIFYIQFMFEICVQNIFDLVGFTKGGRVCQIMSFFLLSSQELRRFS